MTTSQSIKWVYKPAVFVLCLIPLLYFVWYAQFQGLGEEPVKAVTHFTGDWTLRFLLLTLGITPLRRISGFNTLLRFRRMLGLFAFFYACLHFTIYLLDQSFDWSFIIEDVVEHPYVTVGFSCFILLLPLVMTSTNGMVKRLGARRWQRLHKMIYVIAIGGVLHFLWLVKKDITEPMYYAIALTALLGYRLYFYYKSRNTEAVTG
jgi:methionine sulfoxide reductase heme-binding subunit